MAALVPTVMDPPKMFDFPKRFTEIAALPAVVKPKTMAPKADAGQETTGLGVDEGAADALEAPLSNGHLYDMEDEHYYSDYIAEPLHQSAVMSSNPEMDEAYSSYPSCQPETPFAASEVATSSEDECSDDAAAGQDALSDDDDKESFGPSPPAAQDEWRTVKAKPRKPKEPKAGPDGVPQAAATASKPAAKKAGATTSSAPRPVIPAAAPFRRGASTRPQANAFDILQPGKLKALQEAAERQATVKNARMAAVPGLPGGGLGTDSDDSAAAAAAAVVEACEAVASAAVKAAFAAVARSEVLKSKARAEKAQKLQRRREEKERAEQEAEEEEEEEADPAELAKEAFSQPPETAAKLAAAKRAETEKKKAEAEKKKAAEAQSAAAGDTAGGGADGSKDEASTTEEGSTDGQAQQGKRKRPGKKHRAARQSEDRAKEGEAAAATPTAAISLTASSGAEAAAAAAAPAGGKKADSEEGEAEAEGLNDLGQLTRRRAAKRKPTHMGARTATKGRGKGGQKPKAKVEEPAAEEEVEEQEKEAPAGGCVLVKLFRKLSVQAKECTAAAVAKVSRTTAYPAWQAQCQASLQNVAAVAAGATVVGVVAGAGASALYFVPPRPESTSPPGDSDSLAEQLTRC